ncbi:MAG TPA: hypothetical protein VJ249_02900 [Candidatus Bathyarchaeia archaeon]|nr:hypothetical protein [Candidatus Bathyarchaeia archaeon]
MVEDNIASDRRGERSNSEELLLMAAENLKRSIELTVRQLQAKKVRGEMKLRWSRSLTRQVQALVVVAEALNKIGSKSAVDLDLASYLSAVESRVPKTYASRRLALMVIKTKMIWGRHTHGRI